MVKRGAAPAFAAGCVLAALAVAFVEVAFYGLNARNAGRVRLTVEPESGLYAYRLTVGYRPQANGTVEAVKTVDGQEVYRARYTFDERHRRVTEPAPHCPGERLALFFGDSMVFGEGLNDDETLPVEVARRVPAWTALNYAFSGYGPGQAVNQLTDDTLFEYAQPTEAVAVYTFIPHHVRRTIGSMRVVSQWGLHFPYFTANEAGGVDLRETFERGRPERTGWYRFFAREQIGRYFAVDWPVAIGGEDLDLTARVIAAAQKAFTARYPEGRFYVLLYPAMTEDEFSSTRLAPYLARYGVEMLDFTGAVDLSLPGRRIVGDGHPTGAANALLAERLVAALALDKAVCAPPSP